MSNCVFREFSSSLIGHWWTWFRGPNSAVYTQAVYDTTNRHASYTRPMADPGGENTIIMFKSCYPNSNLGGDSAESPPAINDNPLRGQDCGSPYHTVANAKGIYIDLLQYFATRTLVRFDLTGWLSASAQINEAWLDLYAYDSGFDDNAQDAVVHQVTRTWVEGNGWDLLADGRDEGVTWVTARPGVVWASPGGDFDTTELDRRSVAANPDAWQRTVIV